ncbi:hypothetical protein H0I29_01290 [Polaribacter sp. R2A056_3_33]|jgi:hypothetical protein|uniref:hypothetical protein n=1 Tax=Polaribacter sp. R2A056_3_33 TaxID=2745563 RepID=UPI001C4EF734|nr:hypothetical protein [Polaribacter sp. R2A056_3_33]QXP70759.1 hypothetical protein H0I29_01290 [Polaribacter sp. R2A056_3_33]
MKSTTQFALDKQTMVYKESDAIKYIAKKYTSNGSIIYFKENNNEDGFGSLINELDEFKKAELFVPENNLQAVLEFVQELQHSVQNAQLTLKYYTPQHWKKITFQF